MRCSESVAEKLQVTLLFTCCFSAIAPPQIVVDVLFCFGPRIDSINVCIAGLA